MKNLIFIILILYTSILNAQSFMGISIDGTQEIVKSKLIAKGFKLIKSNQTSYYYKGKLNNENISIMVGATPKTRKVYSFYIRKRFRLEAVLL